MTTEPKKGDHVAWNTPQGEISGTVTRKLSATGHSGSHTAQASPDAPQFEVKSDKSGKKAIHKADALKPSK